MPLWPDALIPMDFPLPNTLLELSFLYQLKLLHYNLFYDVGIVKSSPCQIDFCFGKLKKKLDGARWGDYGVCCMCGILCLAKKCCTGWDECADALSWWICQFPGDQFSGHLQHIAVQRCHTTCKQYSLFICDPLEKTPDAQHRLDWRKLWATLLLSFELGVAFQRHFLFFKTAKRFKNLESFPKAILIISYVSVHVFHRFWQNLMHTHSIFSVILTATSQTFPFFIWVAWEWGKKARARVQVRIDWDMTELPVKALRPWVPKCSGEILPVCILFEQLL